ncbi:MAG: hypothetical protein KGZ45_01765 [Clostridium sp.]|nr:hypothetical protein [Clostridium sp.]
MKEVRNLDDKRVCDISSDSKVAEIAKKDCITRIRAKPDGTLQITHERITVKA